MSAGKGLLDPSSRRSSGSFANKISSRLSSLKNIHRVSFQNATEEIKPQAYRSRSDSFTSEFSATLMGHTTSPPSTNSSASGHSVTSHAALFLHSPKPLSSQAPFATPNVFATVTDNIHGAASYIQCDAEKLNLTFALDLGSESGVSTQDIEVSVKMVGSTVQISLARTSKAPLEPSFSFDSTLFPSGARTPDWTFANDSSEYADSAGTRTPVIFSPPLSSLEEENKAKIDSYFCEMPFSSNTPPRLITPVKPFSPPATPSPIRVGSYSTPKRLSASSRLSQYHPRQISTTPEGRPLSSTIHDTPTNAKRHAVTLESPEVWERRPSCISHWSTDTEDREGNDADEEENGDYRNQIGLEAYMIEQEKSKGNDLI